MIAIRDIRKKKMVVRERTFDVEVIEIPFREGVELRCLVGDSLIRISDRQLGETEALRILEREILAKLEAQ